MNETSRLVSFNVALAFTGCCVKPVETKCYGTISDHALRNCIGKFLHPKINPVTPFKSVDGDDLSFSSNEVIPILVPKGTRSSKKSKNSAPVKPKDEVYTSSSHVRSNSCFPAINDQERFCYRQSRLAGGGGVCDTCTLLQEQYEKRMINLKQEVARLTAENSELRCELKTTNDDVLRKVTETGQNMDQLTEGVMILKDSLLRCHSEIASQWTFSLHQIVEKLEVIQREGSRLVHSMIDLVTRIEMSNRREACSRSVSYKYQQQDETSEDEPVRLSAAAAAAINPRSVGRSAIMERAVREDVMKERDIRRIRAILEDFKRLGNDLRMMGRTFEDRMGRTMEAYKKVMDNKEEDISLIRNRCDSLIECLQQTRIAFGLGPLQETESKSQQSQTSGPSQLSQQSQIVQPSQSTETRDTQGLTVEDGEGGAAGDNAALVRSADEMTKQEKENENISTELTEKLLSLQSYVKEMERTRERNSRKSERRISRLMEQLQAKSHAIDVHLTMQRAEIVFELKAAHQSEIERITKELQDKYRQFLQELRVQSEEEIEQQVRNYLENFYMRNQG
ncbi:uncharacterized protein LOC113386615 [Ctenocephalides felis]|uniref:uncharacterized protein LOC113386615 n=1 Tax=Ctenocephalides felis TaxID=7515 RepID=UPI000E6E1157|nr:uncharacterized protein LOC113386615 [Ctenocephalides felis]